jgi:hypothetical protein
MANPAHVAIVRQGAEAILHWQTMHPREHLKLHRADLREANLRGADLIEADLREANLDRAFLIGAALTNANLDRASLEETDLWDAFLYEATLHEANLERAYLVGADLHGADLTGARLEEANLNHADLTEATLTGANLRCAQLKGSQLWGAKLDNALLSDTVFADTVLTRVEGLETCCHEGPSIIDHRTLLRSGRLPLVFLRGCGLPEALIEYLPALLNQPLQYYSCFISYAHQDKAFARRLHADLQDHGVRCWFAPKDLKTGEKFRVRIDESIRVYDKLLLILSQHSVASVWVEKEVETAFEQERLRRQPVLFPVRLDNTVLDLQSGWAADIRRSRHIGDFRRWKSHKAYQQAFARLLRDLVATAVQEEGKRPDGESRAC